MNVSAAGTGSSVASGDLSDLLFTLFLGIWLLTEWKPPGAVTGSSFRSVSAQLLHLIP